MARSKIRWWVAPWGALALVLAGCAGSSPVDDVPSILEPAEEAAAEPENPLPPSEAPVTSPHQVLVGQLSALGYRALGMEFEKPETLEWLGKIFARPEAHNLDVDFVYTGLRMEYDKVRKSLTVGGTRNEKEVFKFLKRWVPQRKAPPPPPPQIETPPQGFEDEVQKAPPDEPVPGTEGM